MKVKSLLDFMPEEQRKKALEKAQRRLERKKANTQDISPELYYMVKLGKHFGWNAFLDAMRGYVTTIDANGKTIKEPFVIEEILASASLLALPVVLEPELAYFLAKFA